ncbi:vacuolar sorting receptor protein, putative [Medicago truncatula]|nr:vacuolar sorting receptor protein, putative [Medicago truncatula]
MAKFVVEKNNLRVTSPDSIKGTYDSTIGNFGIPQYGGSMDGTLCIQRIIKRVVQSLMSLGFPLNLSLVLFQLLFCSIVEV